MFQFGIGGMYGNPLAVPGSSLATPSGPQRFGTLQDVDVEISQKLVELMGQNKLPDDVAPSDMKITGKGAFGALEIDIYNSLMFADSVQEGIKIVAPSELHALGGLLPGGLTAAAIHSGDAGTGFAVNDTLSVTGGGGSGAILQVATESGGVIETFTIVEAGSGYATTSGAALAIITSATGVGPVESDITASADGTGATSTVTHGATFITDLGVQYAGGGYLQPVASDPDQGQYVPGAEDVGTYSFAPADSLSDILISYVYTSAGGNTLQLTNHIQGYGPVFELYLLEPYQGTNGLHLVCCRASKMSKPLKRAGYEISDFEFEAYASPNQVGQNGLPLVAEFFQITA